MTCMTRVQSSLVIDMSPNLTLHRRSVLPEALLARPDLQLPRGGTQRVLTALGHSCHSCHTYRELWGRLLAVHRPGREAGAPLGHHLHHPVQAALRLCLRAAAQPDQLAERQASGPTHPQPVHAAASQQRGAHRRRGQGGLVLHPGRSRTLP